MKVLNEWIKLRHYSDLKNTDNVPGIYIWGFKDSDDEFLPYYVGKAWNIGDRLCSHLSNIKGGSYTVYTQKDIFNTDEDIYIYKPKTIQDRINFILKPAQNNLQNHVDLMIDNFYFTYSKMGKDDFDEFGSDAEKTILIMFKKSDILINTRFGIPKIKIGIGNLIFDRARLKII